MVTKFSSSLSPFYIFQRVSIIALPFIGKRNGPLPCLAKQPEEQGLVFVSVTHLAL
jgi:hypothetical protein